MAYFQSTIPTLFEELKDAINAWIDGFIVHTKTEDDLTGHLDLFCATCAKYKLYLSAKKCEFYARRVKWCGRIIDSEGYQLDPRNIQAIRSMDAGTSAAELCQFIHCCRWMSTSIPDVHKKIQPLAEIIEKAYHIAGKPQKSALSNTTLHKLS